MYDMTDLPGEDLDGPARAELDRAAKATLVHGDALRPVGVTLDAIYATGGQVDFAAGRYVAAVTTPSGYMFLGRYGSSYGSEAAIEKFYSGMRALLAPADGGDL